MKGKKLTSTLIASVAILWSVVFYRLYATMSDKNEIITTNNTKKMVFFNAINHINDSVNLDLNYRDPFSLANTLIEIEKEALPQRKISISAHTIPKPNANWENIFYTGYINNVNSKQKLALISIHGKEILLAEGQTLSGLKLITYSRDSIKIRYQNHTKFIKLR